MRIRKLELHGFKSFPDKTALNFGAGLACVIGPNGCGKSNIVDAIKWCVGEQSAKSLRGDDMLDVIFAGSAERAPVGYAEVTLTLSAEGGEPLPGDYARFTEIQIGRRLFRTGNSEYLINGQRVRRKDVVDLLLDTGIGNNLYSFIEQGKIGEIVHTSPDKRRTLIDEAAGITRYKARRDEAQQQLEATAAQLDRAADVADEMGRRVKVLESQVLKAARFRRLRTVVRFGEITLSLAKYAELSQKRSVVSENLRRGQDAVDASERESARLTTDVEELRGAVEIAELLLGESRDTLAEVEVKIRELENAVAFLERQKTDLSAEGVRVAVAWNDSNHELEAAEKERQLLMNDAEELRQNLLQRASAEQEAKQLLSAAELQRIEARNRVQQRQREHAEAVEQHGEERARVIEFDTRLANLPVRKNGLVERLQDIIARQTEIEAIQIQRIANLEAQQQQREELVVQLTARELDFRQAIAHEDAARLALKQAELHAETVRKQGQAKEDQAQAETQTIERQISSELRTQEARSEEKRKQIRSETDRTNEQLRQASRTRLQQAEERGRIWQASASKANDEEFRRISAEVAARETAEEAVTERQSAEIEGMLNEQLRKIEEQAREKFDQAVSLAEQSRLDARTDTDACEQELRGLESKLIRSRGERTEAEGKRRGLMLEAHVDVSGEQGIGIARGLLENPENLVDILEVPTEDEAWVSRVLDEQLLAPWVSSLNKLEAIGAAVREKGRVTLFYSPNRPQFHQVLGATHLVESLAAAVAQAQLGRTSVVRTTGERVEPDGRVVLGRAGVAAQAALQRRRKLLELDSQLAALTDQISEIEHQRDQCRHQTQLATQVLEQAIKERKRVEEEGRSQLQKMMSTAREDTKKQITQSIQQTRSTRAEQRLRYQQELSEFRKRGEIQRNKLVEVAEQTLKEMRLSEERWLEKELQARQELTVLAIQEVEVSLEQIRTESTTQIKQTREQTLAIREQIRKAWEKAIEDSNVFRGQVEQAISLRESNSRFVEELKTKLRGVELATVKQEADQAAAATELQRLIHQKSSIDEELLLIEREHEELRQVLVRRMALAAELLEHRDQAAEQLRNAQEEAKQHEAHEVRVRDQVRKMELERAKLEERTRGIADAIGVLKKRAEEATSRRQRAEKRQQEIIAELAENSQQFEDSTVRLASLGDDRELQSGELSRRRDESTGARKKLREHELLLQEAIVRREELRHRMTSLEAEISDHHRDIEVLRLRIDERYQLSLAVLLDQIEVQGETTLEVDAAARDGFSTSDEKVLPIEPLKLTVDLLKNERWIAKTIENLESRRAELSQLGEVNLAAQDEYRELIERHRELLAQRLDLESSVESIRSAIAKMNRTCRERFRDAFDRVNENFQRSYPRLVGGGMARLALTDEEDLLETGVDIFVQPPGKRLQNLTLLSGGEKAMAAIALLLSLFQVKPSPFCLLDEVDAPLDEANGARFNEMLKEMSSISQFIVITHNRKTMEAADTLYGITMSAPGCSRLVTARLGI